MKLEIKYEDNSETKIYSVVRKRGNGDYVLDVKPRIYIELESPYSGENGISYKGKDGKYHWQGCYIITSKGHRMGLVRRVEE